MKQAHQPLGERDTPYRDRTHGGQELAAKLTHYANRPDVIVLGLPRGGVPVAYEVARALQAPLDVFLVRKLGVPGHEELAMGALAGFPSQEEEHAGAAEAPGTGAPGGAPAGGCVRVLNESVVRSMRIPEHVLDSAVVAARQELARREQLYRGGRPAPDLAGRTVILVDDGLATGSTMRSAAAALGRGTPMDTTATAGRLPARVVVAVPTAAAETCAELSNEVDEVVCAMTPQPFYAVGLWYEDFDQTSDDEVRALLARAAQELADGGG